MTNEIGFGGILGTGNTDDLYVPPTTPIDLGDNFVTEQIDCGSLHCCGVSSNKTLKCWGPYLYCTSKLKFFLAILFISVSDILFRLWWQWPIGSGR